MAHRWLCLILVASLGNVASGADLPESPSLTLLESGQEPRRELRYDYAAGATETMEMTLDMSLSQKINGKKRKLPSLPTQIMTMTLTTDQVTDKGNAVVESHLKNVEVAGSDVPQAVLDAVRSRIQGMVGLTVTRTISPRGKTLEHEFQLPEGAGDQVKRTFGSIEQSLARLSVPMPEEPVGLGAKWKVMMPIKMANIKMTQEVIYTVTELTADSVTLEIELTQRAPEQDIPLPGGNGSTHMKSYQGRGSGRMTIHFDQLVPTSTLETSNENVVVAGPQDVKVETTANVTVRMKPTDDNGQE